MPRVLELGLGGYAALVEEAKERLDLCDWADLRKRQLYLAMAEALAGVSAFVGRFACLARNMAIDCADSHRRAELLRIADTCEAIAERPPRTFRQALQLTYFLQLVLQIESNGHSLSLGRMDQYLRSYYERDLEEKRMTREAAGELLSCTWIKLVEIKKVRSWSHTRYSAGGPLYQNVTIGGVTRAGKDAVNDLSYLILETVGEMKLTQPNLSVRYHRGMSEDFLRAVVEVIRKGFGMPAFNNDEVVIPGMLKLGVSLEDARDYSAIGCIEVAVPGKWGYRTTGMSFLNLMRVLLATLDDGFDHQAGKAFLPGTGKLASFAGFDELMAAWKKQLAFYSRATVAIDCAVDSALGRRCPTSSARPSPTTASRAASTSRRAGRSTTSSRASRSGSPTWATPWRRSRNSSSRRPRSRPAVMGALASDFAGLEGEALRLRLLNRAPKYGNDDDYVDELVVEAYGAFVAEMAKYHNTRYGRGPIGGAYYPGTSSISSNVPSGAVVSATPDGRKAWTPLAEGCSPSRGTAVGPHGRVQVGGQASDRGHLRRRAAQSEALARFAEGRRGARQARRHGQDLLRRAPGLARPVQHRLPRDPARRQGLPRKAPRTRRARNGLYSAFFNDLAEEQQDDIIARTEQEL